MNELEHFSCALCGPRGHACASLLKECYDRYSFECFIDISHYLPFWAGVNCSLMTSVIAAQGSDMWFDCAAATARKKMWLWIQFP